jgi:hypothetical protein
MSLLLQRDDVGKVLDERIAYWHRCVEVFSVDYFESEIQKACIYLVGGTNSGCTADVEVVVV